MTGARTPWMVVLIFLSTALSGCGGLSHPVDPQPASPGELTSHAARVQPGKETHLPATTSPRAAYHAFQQTIREKRYEDTWTLLSSGTQDRCRAAAADLKVRVLNYPAPRASDLDILYFSGLTRRTVKNLTGKMYFVASSKMRDKDPEAFAPVIKSEYDHEVIRGGEAKVYVKINGRRTDEPMTFVQEGGVWRVDLPGASGGN